MHSSCRHVCADAAKPRPSHCRRPRRPGERLRCTGAGEKGAESESDGERRGRA